MNAFLSILYIFSLYGAFAAASIVLRRSSVPTSNPGKLHFPQTTFLLVLAIAIPSVLQFFFPALLSTFQRDYERFRSGEWWRLISPLFVQDGGVGGTIFNLIALAFVGSAAERMWNGKYMLMTFFVGGIIGEIVGFAWQPVGAGNSLGNFSLAAGIAVASLTRNPPKPAQILGILALSANAILLGLQDIHGAAALMGAILALFLSRGGYDTAQTVR